MRLQLDQVLHPAVDVVGAVAFCCGRYGADLDTESPKGWTPLSYAKARGKYGPTEEAGIYPEDVLLYYGASVYGSGPPALGVKSPRNSYDPAADGFSRERGSYQQMFEHP